MFLLVNDVLEFDVFLVTGFGDVFGGGTALVEVVLDVASKGKGDYYFLFEHQR